MKELSGLCECCRLIFWREAGHTVANAIWITFMHQLIVPRIGITILLDIVGPALLEEHLAGLSQVRVILRIQTFMIVCLVKSKELPGLV